MFFLLYAQYGGCGLQLTYADLQEMYLNDIFWFLEALKEARDKEASALSNIRR